GAISCAPRVGRNRDRQLPRVRAQLDHRGNRKPVMHAVTPRHAASTRTPVMSARGLQKQTGRDDRDGPLVEALRRRDADAAERLVTTYQSRAYRLAVGITANAEDAERSEEHTSELQSRVDLVCRLLL